MPATPARILYIEDNKLSHRMVRLMLKPVGEVDCETTLAGGWAAFETRGPYDLILCDLGFPEGDAWPLLFRIRRKVSPLELPIVMLTSTWDKATLAKFYQAGTNCTVHKPPQPVEFQHLVSRMLLAPWIEKPDHLIGDAQTISWTTPTGAVAFCPNFNFREEADSPEAALRQLQQRIQSHVVAGNVIPLLSGISTGNYIPKSEA